MLEPTKINEIVEKVLERLPQGLRDMPKDLEKNLKVCLQDVFAKMDLVTREEFDTQVAVLHKARKKLEDLEQKIQEIEKSSDV